MRAGEILGIAGVDGNGQTELIDATKLRRPSAGRVTVDGEDVTQSKPRDCLDAGLGHIPEDRQRRGLVLDFSSPRTSPCTTTTRRRPASAGSTRAG